MHSCFDLLHYCRVNMVNMVKGNYKKILDSKSLFKMNIYISETHLINVGSSFNKIYFKFFL